MMKSATNLSLSGIEGIRFLDDPVFPTIVLTKIAERTCGNDGEWESASRGVPAGRHRLPVGYVVEGELLQPVKVGQVICVLRRVRNGVAVRGLFVSREVVEIGKERIVTMNAVYRADFER